MLVLQAWVLVLSHVVPRPSIKSAILNVGDVIRNKVIPQPVPLVDGAPKLSSLPVHGNSYRIAYAGRIDPDFASVWIEFENVGSVILGLVVVGVIGVRIRTY